MSEARIGAFSGQSPATLQERIEELAVKRRRRVAELVGLRAWRRLGDNLGDRQRQALNSDDRAWEVWDRGEALPVAHVILVRDDVYVAALSLEFTLEDLRFGSEQECSAFNSEMGVAIPWVDE